MSFGEIIPSRHFIRQVKSLVVSLSDKQIWFSISRKDHVIRSIIQNHVFYCVLDLEVSIILVIRKFPFYMWTNVMSI